MVGLVTAEAVGGHCVLILGRVLAAVVASVAMCGKWVARDQIQFVS